MSDYDCDDFVGGGFQIELDEGDDMSGYNQAGVVPRDLVCHVCGSRQFTVTDET